MEYRGGLVEGLAMLGLQRGAQGALEVKRSQGGHRGGHCLLQGCRRPCWRCREKLRVSEHFAGGEEGALGMHNHCRDRGEEGSWTLGELVLGCLGADCKRMGGPWSC